MQGKEIQTRDLICIVCPRGCAMHVELCEGQVIQVTGNTCPRGQKYAVDECTHPVRTLTTTVRTVSGSVVPVKTDRPIPRELIMQAMQELQHVTAPLPLHIGDVLVENLLGTGAQVVATDEREA